MGNGNGTRPQGGLTIDAPIFLRWAGGKRWLIPKLREHFNGHRFKNYFEPFLGAGSFFLGWGHAVADRFHLSDREAGLIETFQTIKTQPDKALKILGRWQPNKSTYLDVRGATPNGNLPWNAARFIFLNRLCWNGLFRVNLAGKFNVPYSPKHIPENLAEIILDAGTRLNRANVKLTAGDYKSVLHLPKAGDIVVLDPPYVSQDEGRPPNRCYNAEQFTWQDQEELAAAATRLASRGVAVVVTPGRGAHALYSARFFSKIGIFRNQNIAANSDDRCRYRENLLISKGWGDYAKKAR